MKRLAPFAFTLSAALPMAAHAELYVGLDLAAGRGETEFDGFSSSSYDIDTTQAALKAGYITRSGNRLQLSIGRIDIEDDAGVEQEFSGIDFDAKFPFGDRMAKPFLGAGFGIYTWEDTGAMFIDGEDLSGVALNLSGGVLLELHEQFDLEVGLQYKAIIWESIRPIFSDEEIDVTTGLVQVMAGANVRF